MTRELIKALGSSVLKPVVITKRQNRSRAIVSGIEGHCKTNQLIDLNYSSAIRKLAAVARGAKNRAITSIAPNNEKWAVKPRPA